MVSRKIDHTIPGNPSTNTELVNCMIDKERMIKMKNSHAEEKTRLKAEWERNKDNITAFEEKIELVKNKITFLKGILKDYYKNLLKQGTDTRYKFPDTIIH